MDNLEIAIYQSKDGDIQLEVKLLNETIWLSLNQIAELFDRDKSVIPGIFLIYIKKENYIKTQLLQNMQQFKTKGKGLLY
ncbi:MAG: hypothetical protein ACK4ND_05805 [Cytophagaceae bacterium]